MRPAVFALVCCLFACQEPDTRVDTVTVHWMDWPAEVNAGQEFRTRLVVEGVCALNPRFRAGAGADHSAVTFEPYFIVDKQPVECVAAGSTEFVAVGSLDTAGIAPGLSASSARTYEMRGSMYTFVPQTSLTTSIPVGTFGSVVVRPTGADASRRNAAGYARIFKDTLGCVRLITAGLYGPNAVFVLEDQTATTTGTAFVRGYIYDAATPVCGETRVFHLI